jgi:hypothetical protein
VDAIVCLDACFTQKRRKPQGSAWNEPHTHPETVFVSTDEVNEVENMVESVRPTPKKAEKQKGKFPQTPSHAGSQEPPPLFEPGMRVPTAVLDGCNDSFVAADERRIKASTLFFADTGLMALICRHDRVLWLVNMTSPGEKQHYALCLLWKLFSYIPRTMRIGILYDIGCQLVRSCLKYGFLSSFLDRLIFGISVFHAYGHQWPCQIIYHPRKCEGFGLTDGEGCERFWSSIQSLIPSCRVSTYFNRIYAIDTQIKALDQKSLLGLGGWMRRKWIAMMTKMKEAEEVLSEIYEKGYTEAVLHQEWIHQVAEQTKPLKQQSKGLADQQIREILALKNSCDEYKAQIDELETMILEGNYAEETNLDEVQESLEEYQAKLAKLQKSMATKKNQLSVDGRLNLIKLMGNEFLKKRMNALALKQRLRDRLCHRKFELENVERAYRNTVNHAKLEAHTKQQVKRKEPGIQTLARKYNSLCKDLVDMIKLKKAPQGAVAPLPIEMDGLFKLDIDDDIWQDIGLTDENDENVEIPAWLGDENVRQGIKSMLDIDRCIEERDRLIAECISMRQWMREEWAIVISAIHYSVEDPDVVYQLNERRNNLLRLCVAWDRTVKLIPIEDDLPWGPDLAELAEARHFEYNESVNTQIIVDKTQRNLFDMSEMYEDIEDKEEEEMEEMEVDLEDERDAELMDEVEMTF